MLPNDRIGSIKFAVPETQSHRHAWLGTIWTAVNVAPYCFSQIEIITDGKVKENKIKTSYSLNNQCSFVFQPKTHCLLIKFNQFFSIVHSALKISHCKIDHHHLMMAWNGRASIEPYDIYLCDGLRYSKEYRWPQRIPVYRIIIVFYVCICVKSIEMREVNPIGSSMTLGL